MRSGLCGEAGRQGEVQGYEIDEYRVCRGRFTYSISCLSNPGTRPIQHIKAGHHCHRSVYLLLLTYSLRPPQGLINVSKNLWLLATTNMDTHSMKLAVNSGH